MLTGIILVLAGGALFRCAQPAVEYDLGRLWPQGRQRALAIGLTALAVVAVLAGLGQTLTGQALAAEGGYTIDLAPALGPLGEVLALVVVTFAGWALKRLFAYLGLREDDKVRAYLETAFLSGLSLALERALRAGLNMAEVETRHQLVAEGARYVMDAVPDALARFKLDEDGVRERLTARLGYVAPLPGQQVVLSPEIAP